MISNQELRLHLGELTAEECRIAKAAYRLGMERAKRSIEDAIKMAEYLKANPDAMKPKA